MKHTESPWYHSMKAKHNIMSIAPGMGRFTICTMKNTHRENWMADAALIVAAPDMLEALKALIACPDYQGINTHEMRNAASAIRKAEGGTL